MKNAPASTTVEALIDLYTLESDRLRDEYEATLGIIPREESAQLLRASTDCMGMRRRARMETTRFVWEA